jgi:hypothetical protein
MFVQIYVLNEVGRTILDSAPRAGNKQSEGRILLLAMQGLYTSTASALPLSKLAQ